MKELFLKIHLNRILFRTLQFSTGVKHYLYRMQLETKLIIFIPLLILFLFGKESWAKGGAVGNGGDLVQCRSTLTKQIEYKSLDYLLTMRSLGDRDFLPVTSLGDSFQQIQKLLDEKIPELAPSFRNFIQHLWNENLNKTIIWEKSPFGVTPVHDEEIGSAHSIPSQCRESEKQGGPILLVQAIIRLRERFSPTEAKRVYAYMDELIGEVERKDPLQISFLLVHEWLWEHSKNVERNRRVNRLLHTPSFYQLSSNEIKSQLQGLGLILPEKSTLKFENQFCQANSSSMDELLMQKNKLSLGDFQILSRTRLCTSKEGCPSFGSPKLGAIPEFSPGFIAPYFDKANVLKLYNEASSGRSKPVATCELNKKGETLCSRLGEYTDFSYEGKYITFIGNVSSDCLHLRFNLLTPQGRDSWVETQLVLWSSFRE